MSSSTINERLILSPFDLREVLTLRQAAAIARQVRVDLASLVRIGRLRPSCWRRYLVRSVICILMEIGRPCGPTMPANWSDPNVVYYFEREGPGVLLGSRRDP
jgi:hypothetical protein